MGERQREKTSSGSLEAILNPGASHNRKPDAGLLQERKKEKCGILLRKKEQEDFLQ